MRTLSSPPRARRRAVVVAVLVALGVLVPIGVGHAAATAPAPAAAEPGGRGDGDDPICADGKRDTNPADGICNRDKDKRRGDKGDAKPGKDGAKDEGAVCADGKRDDNPSNGVCTRDKPATDPNLVPGTPCARSAHACADLGAKKAWLIRDGKVVRGPVRIAHGGKGHETPRGTFAVQWKSKDHRSMEFDNAPMPFAVFFTDGGVAFHQGDLGSNSHGCIRLAREDAEAFFNFLDRGDEVQVH